MAQETHLRLTPQQTNILGLKLKLELAQGIIELGGRTSIVRSICGISKASALQLHREIWGENPKAGMLPSDPEWLVKTPRNCVHSSIFYTIYTTLSACPDYSKAEIYLTTYRLYLDQIKGEDKIMLDINRAWQIVQQNSMNLLEGIQCRRCQLTHVAIKSYPKPYQYCPLCDSETDKMGRLKYKNFNVFSSNTDAKGRSGSATARIH